MLFGAFIKPLTDLVSLEENKMTSWGGKKVSLKSIFEQKKMFANHKICGK